MKYKNIIQSGYSDATGLWLSLTLIAFFPQRKNSSRRFKIMCMKLCKKMVMIEENNHHLFKSSIHFLDANAAPFLPVKPLELRKSDFIVLQIMHS